jgi:hypothetical protein
MGNGLTRAVVGHPKDTAAVEPVKAESAIAKLDGQIRILEKRIDHSNLLLKNARQKALTKGQAGDKAGALHELTRAKQIEKDLNSYHGILETLHTQRHALEQASFQVDTLKVIETANKHLNSTTGQVSVEKAEEIMEASEEAKQNLEEIQHILVGPPRDTSEEEAELAAMMANNTVPSTNVLPAQPTPIANPLLAPPARVDPIQEELKRLEAMDQLPAAPAPAAQTRIAIPN